MVFTMILFALVMFILNYAFVTPTYLMNKPQPVRRVEIAKSDGGVRNLRETTVLDRFVQQAIA